jgi:16S rRNA (guanine527-N7)-methyltransferase
VDAHTHEACDTYVHEALRFSRALSLTSIRNAPDFHRNFVVPSLALCPWMPAQGRLLDIGSGMGIPGVPILIACAGLHGILVERRRKRAEFLRHVVRLLKLDAEVYDRDVRDLEGLHVDVCVARAVSRPDALLDLCVPHANVGARAVFPVADDCEVVSVPGWQLEKEQMLNEGVAQKVQIYRYAEVSRET